MTTLAIGYTRVSSQDQGRSGLGLEAQREAIERHARAHGVEVMSWHTDVQSGGCDERVGLLAALAQCRQLKASLIVAKLDRLSRDLAYITQIMKRTDLLVVDLGGLTDTLTLQILGAVAQQERKAASERTKAALAAKKARGEALGASPAALRKRSKVGCRVQREAAQARAEDLRWVFESSGVVGESHRAAAATLNVRRVPTPRGGVWSAQQVLRVRQRLGL